MTTSRRGTRSLSGKIFSTVLVFTLCVIAVMSVVLTSIYYVSFERDGEMRLMSQARNAAVYLNEASSGSNLSTLEEQFAGLVRFTLIDPDGVVLFDSSTPDASTLPNHASRPEVQAAEASGEGAVTRFSETLGTDTVYAAVLLDDGSVVRLSESRESLLAFAGGLIVPVVTAFAVAALLVLMLSRLLTRRIMKPIDALDFSDPLENEIYEEMSPLLVRIDEQQRQLKAQNEELARAESLRRDFSANVSHEMKTPLQVISGYAELMESGLVPPEDTARFAGLIYSESQAMRSLINDVLTLSRLDEVQTPLEHEAMVLVDVLGVARRAAGRLTMLANEHDVSVEVSGTGAVMRGNETLVEEMAYNLIENGIRYNHAGGSVKVVVCEEEGAPLAGAAAGEGEGAAHAGAASPALGGAAAAHAGAATAASAAHAQRQVVVRVTDTGPGIPADKHEKIFERFYRMEKSRSKETGGTGLGLAIVKHAVLYHGGTIVVESELGHGTTFILRFPAE
ncbi:ATP-binding protein [Adlercreutzia sp. ZJ242]|uniref:sensor histidine kinase n=1 Tax=Adlercreutzia sp. ZJ242 TaxID=2709409 RepID=UPI0013EBBBC0|nr:ATP-binding protein [Adlercreutzia sp. ZJ242]